MSFALLLDFTGYIEYLLFVLLGSAVGIGYIVRYTLVFFRQSLIFYQSCLQTDFVGKRSL